MRLYSIRIWLAAIALLLVIHCDEENDLDQTGTLVGIWKLTELRVDWVRDVASPAGIPADTVYLASGHLVDSLAFSNVPAFMTPQTIMSFMAGDTILDTIASLKSFVLEIMGISLTATFNEDFSYTITGTYPTLRLIEDSCRTEMIIPQIFDSGTYVADYITGSFGIQPGQFEQVLPTFDDGELKIYNNGLSAEIKFVDRQAHDQYTEADGGWDEAKRVIHGAATMPVDNAGAFSSRGLLGSTGYIRDWSGSLARWGNFLTLYALTIKVAVEELTEGDSYTEEEAMLILEQRAADGLNENITGLEIAYLDLLEGDDSDHEFDETNAAAGGKLRFEIVNPVCVPVNQIIDYATTWTRISQD